MSTEPNPYAPPGADLGRTPPEKGAAWKAIVFGLLSDIALTMVLSILFFAFYSGYLILTGTPADQIGDAFNADAGDAIVTVGLLVTGGAGSMLGGFICARVAKHSEYRLGAILTAISLVLGFLFITDEPIAIVLMSTTVTVAATFAGVWTGVRLNRSGR